MNERLNFLNGFVIDVNSPDSVVIFGALVFCLTPEVACQALDVTFEQCPRKRQAIMRKIQSDMSVAIRDCHRKLLKKLEKNIEALPGSKKISAANTLLFFARRLPEKEEHKVLKRLATCKNGNVRVQIYRRLKELPENICPDYLLEAWQIYREFEATRLLLNRASVETLSHNFDGLEEDLSKSGPLLSRLYLRLKGDGPAALERLERLNPLSHAYVCAKLHVSLSPEHLLALYSKEISGLVVWCAGQMQQWDTVMEMHRLEEEFLRTE
ncbi:MAG: hypothetical protein HYV06_07210 [Deltaproteobacteria bacterium]|nr:hypothetical protein [Deltaproteobacteria bacterium]